MSAAVSKKNNITKCDPLALRSEDQAERSYRDCRQWLAGSSRGTDAKFSSGSNYASKKKK
jgi:hypothetical protein